MEINDKNNKEKGEEMTAIVISALPCIASGMVLFFLQRFFKKKAKRDEERDAMKRRENILIMKTLDAVGKLTQANAIAIRDGKTNGEMKAAIEAYTKANKELYEFLLEQNSR